jgi:hypothetical protein
VKSVWRLSSQLMSSFEKDRPGMSLHFFSQKMDVNDHEENIPSTAANTMRWSANDMSL